MKLLESTPLKVLLGAATLCPLVFIAFFVCFMFGVVFFEFMAESKIEDAFPFFLVLFILLILTIPLLFALTAIYFGVLFKSDRVTQDKRTFWTVAFLLGGPITMALFFTLYIWKTPGQAQKGHNTRPEVPS